MLETARTWLWNNRKVLVTTLLVYGLLYGLFFLPQVLVWWAVGMGVLMLYERYLAEGSWPIQYFSLLDFIDLVSFFFLTASLLMATDLYSWPLAILLLAVSVEVWVGIKLRFWRERVVSRRQWLY